MRESRLLPMGGDVVATVCDLIESSGAPPQDSLVIFPSRRPKALLARELARRHGRALMAPRCFSIGDWIGRCAEELGYDRIPISAADGAALIHQLHPERRLLGGARQMELEAFLSWGLALFDDFEELKSEGVSPEKLDSVKALAQEPLPPSFGDQLSHLGQWYQEFYQELSRRGLGTPAGTAEFVALNAGRIDLSAYAQVIAAGFYALTRSEQRVLEALMMHPNAVLVLRDGPGIERAIEQLKARPKKAGGEKPAPEIRHIRAADSHGQVMALQELIEPGETLSDTVLVLTEEETVFPVIHHLLPRLEGKWNISMGYPLSRTPLWGMVEALAEAHEGSQDGSYFLPQYLKLVLHPYIKNLSLGGASYPTRILLHAVEEALNGKRRRLVRPDRVLSDPEIKSDIDKRLAGLSDQGSDSSELYRQLGRIHGLAIEPFERVSSVADFAAKLTDLVSEVAQNGTAGRHPYAAGFFQEMARVLSELGSPLMAEQRFDHIRTYFALLKHFASRASVPFPGTPLEGLQVLGFMETRNLSFKRVVVLDANEGSLPVTSSVDTILPQALRRELGLPTAADRELLDRYHFRNLIAGSDEVVLCYRQGEGAQRSRFLEQLDWEQEKVKGEAGKRRLARFRASFGQRDPEPIAKTPEMLEAIGRLPYSATMLDCYLGCGRRFCHRYLMRIREKEEASSEVDAGEVGGLVHQALKYFFEPRLKQPFAYNKAMEREMAESVDRVFLENYGQDQDGGVYLIKSQVKTRLAQFLGYLANSLPQFTVTAVEREHRAALVVAGAGMVTLYGILDRIDHRGDQTVIVDYKTGRGDKPSFDNFAAQGRAQWPRWLRSVQLPFYIMLYLAAHPEAAPASVNSELLKLGGRNFERKELFAEGADRAAMMKSYGEAIETLICEIRDPSLPFFDAWDPGRECPQCPYKLLCGRQWVGEGHR